MQRDNKIIFRKGMLYAKNAVSKGWCKESKFVCNQHTFVITLKFGLTQWRETDGLIYDRTAPFLISFIKVIINFGRWEGGLAIATSPTPPRRRRGEGMSGESYVKSKGAWTFRISFLHFFICFNPFFTTLSNLTKDRSKGNKQM